MPRSAGCCAPSGTRWRPSGRGGAWLVTGRRGERRRDDDRPRARPGHEDQLRACRARGVDRAIRLSTAIAVLAVAGVAAYVSYWHAYAVVRAHGETGDHRPAGAGHDRRPGVRQLDGQSCTRRGTGSRYPPWPAGCSRWASSPRSPRTWPRAGPTGQSGRSSRPGPRSASWASYELLVWIIRTAAAGTWAAGQQRTTAGRRRTTPVPVVRLAAAQEPDAGPGT